MDSPVRKRVPLRLERRSSRREAPPKPSFIKSILLWRGRSEVRVLRYALTFGLPLLGLWALVISYLVLTPKTYTSDMTLNLPGATTSSNISLDNIGQASTSSGNPFSSASLSPKVIYKALAEGFHVRGRAAQILGRPNGLVGKPVVKLIDETAIMEIKVSSGSPEKAQKEAVALEQALQQYLSELRQDEVSRRSNAVKESLKEVTTNLAEARKKLLEFQKKFNIVSADQFRSLIANAEVNRQKLIQLRSEQEGMRTQSESLSALLGVTPAEATLALQVQADPRFSAISAELAAALTEDSANRGKWGKNHPKVAASGERLAAAQSAMRTLALKTAGKKGRRIADHLLLSDSRDRAELFRKLVEYRASSDGIGSQIASIESELKMHSSVLDEQNVNASTLEDLERDHKIAEAVFSSALARVDTNRQDIYASYPLLQVLVEPSQPDSPSSPKRSVAIGGGMGGTILILLGLVLAWIREPIIRKILKNA